MPDIAQQIRAFILEQFLPGENAEALRNDTPLISTGILDSIATLKLVAFLEEEFRISIDAHEVDVDHLETIDRICRLVQAKQ